MVYGEWVRNAVLRNARWALVPVLLLGLAGGGCSVGAYPIDFFQEMHYSPSFRVQEVPRLDKPASAVPFAGAGVAQSVDAPQYWELKPYAEMANVKNPVAKNADSMKRAKEVYRINCAGCHGQHGLGADDTPPALPALLFKGNGVQPPANFAKEPLALSRTEGQLFWIITNGTASLPGREADRGNMPAFRKFLSTEDRWGLVNMVLECRTGGPDCAAVAP